MNKEFLPSMIRNNSGHVVTTASTAGFTGVYRLVDYCSSKHAVFGFHESLVSEIKRLGADRINTTMICPNYTGTGMCDGVTSPVPILDPEYVTDRMLEGILTNQRLVLIPRTFYLMIFLKWFLPTEVYTYLLNDILGAHKSMDTFIGNKN